MNKTSLVLAAVAGLSCASMARADLFSSINGFSVYDRWFGDYPATNINVTNGGLSSLRFQETNYLPGTGWATRNVAFVSANGTPFQFDPSQGFRIDTFVTINSNSFATEAGIIVGTAPNLPTSAGANTGDFHIRVPDGEIAAFGGVNPFFSNSSLPNLPWPTITTGQTYHMTLIYNTSAYGSSMNFGVNGVFTGDLPSAQLLPGSYVGVFAQGPNNSVAPGYAKDVLYTNTTVTVPAPASIALLGLGGLIGTRRRR